MTTDSTVLAFQHPDQLDDPLTSVLRDGARRLLAQAIEVEAEAFLAAMKDERLGDGRARVVRHGHGPERTIQTGIGPVPVRRAKLRDRGEGERIAFSSAILPKWARRTKSLEALLPVLYLRGISTGDFQEALSALLGSAAPNLSPSVIGRLKEEWTAEYERWCTRCSAPNTSSLSTTFRPLWATFRPLWKVFARTIRSRAGRRAVRMERVDLEAVRVQHHQLDALIIRADALSLLRQCRPGACGGSPESSQRGEPSPSSSARSSSSSGQ